MEKIETLKVLLGIDTDVTKDNLLNTILTLCDTAAAEYCNRDSMPTEADGLIVQMAVEKYNKLGKEGAAAQSFSGVSESFIDGYSKEIYHSLNRYRKVKAV